MPLIITDTLDALEKLKTTYSSHSTPERLAFVPTMGNLHAGHLNLVKLAAEQADRVVVSLFVNRLQFAPHEDFDRYPRTQEEDIRALESLKLTIPITVFAPSEHTLYPNTQSFRIQPDPMADTLEGSFRPKFFEGVCTVVLKLFNIVKPTHVVFGKKDRQQLTLIKQMISQFALPIILIEGETLRDSDGLALSSRNRYLSQNEKMQASQLYQQLCTTAHQLRHNNSAPCPESFQALEQEAVAALISKGWQVDYIAIRDQPSLAGYPAERSTPMIILAAAKLGNTRLIDNIEV
jgi:pantoate--beta-alanine ligase